MNLCILTMARFIFLLMYFPIFRGAGFFDICRALLTGIRFDLSTTFLIYTVFFIALILPGNWSVSKIYRLIIKFLVFIITFAAILALGMDINYYGYANRHISGEGINILNDAGFVLKLMFTTYLFHFLIVLAIAAVIYAVLGKIFGTKPFGEPRHFFKTTLISILAHGARFILNFIILAAVAVVSIRGGLQPKPLRTSYAFINDKIVLGHLALNGIYTTLQAMYKSKNILKIPYDYGAAAENIKKMLADEKSIFLDKKYPLFRQNSGLHPRGAGAPPNVVIFIMESWSADEIGVLGGAHDVTPCFDKLSKEGLLFSNCFSVGQRSIDAVMSILMSFPSNSASSVIGKVYEQNQMIGLGNILKAKGYSTMFICGANRGSMGFDAFAAKAGFARYIAKDDFKLPEKCFDGTWGIFDEYAFERADEEFSKMKKPFFAVLYTLNPHAPYKVPEGKFKKYTSGEHAPFLNALYYADWSLGRFFALAKKSAYFKNTLFIIVADHPEGHHEKGIYAYFRVPCLFYYPGKIQPAIIDKAASHLSIMPSIIDLLDLDVKHSSFGKSLFRENSDFALIGYGNIFGWFRGDYVFLRTPEKPIGFYNFRKDPLFQNDLLGKNPSNEKIYNVELLSTLKLSTQLLYDNKIAPLKY